MSNKIKNTDSCDRNVCSTVEVFQDQIITQTFPLLFIFCHLVLTGFVILYVTVKEKN